MAILTTIGNTLTSVIGWVGDVVSAMLDSNGALNDILGLFTIGIAISVLLLAFKAIRKLSWGA